MTILDPSNHSSINSSHHSSLFPSQKFSYLSFQLKKKSLHKLIIHAPKNFIFIDDCQSTFIPKKEASKLLILRRKTHHCPQNTMREEKTLKLKLISLPGQTKEGKTFCAFLFLIQPSSNLQ